MRRFSLMGKVMLLGIFLTALLAMGSKDALADKPENIKSVQVIGSGAINAARREKDRAEAREKAIKNALRLAVQEVALEVIPAESVIQNFGTLTALLHDNTNDFILGYKVLAESEYGGFWKVLLQARVSIDNLQTRMPDGQMVHGKKTMPSLLFLIAEQGIGEASPQYWWDKENSASSKSGAENQMVEVMRKKGITVIEHGVMQQNMGQESTISASDPDNQAAVQLGILFKADVVIVGKSNGVQMQNTLGENIRSFKGTVSIRAIQTDTGREIASTTQSSVAANSDTAMGGAEAIRGAGSLAANELAPKIIAAWQEAEGEKSSLIEIVIERTQNFSDFVLFRKAVSEVPGVKEVQNKTIKPKEAVVMVNFQGDANALAEALMLKTFDSFGIKISNVSGKAFRVELTPH